VANETQQLLQQAVQHLTQGRSRAALPLLQNAVEQTPDSFDAYCLLAVCLGQLNMMDSAFAAAHRSIALNPASYRGHYNLGVLQQRAGKFPEARQAFEHALQLEPNYEGARRALASLPIQVWMPDWVAAFEQGRAARYRSGDWQFSLAYPPDWEILWQDTPAGRWTSAIALSSREASDDRVGLVVNVCPGRLLEGEDTERILNVGPEGQNLKVPRTVGEYVERSSAELGQSFFGLQLISGEVTRLADHPASRLIYTYDRSGKRVEEECATLFGDRATFEFTFEAPMDQFPEVEPVLQLVIGSLTLEPVPGPSVSGQPPGD
jgi:hypothetical protein